MKVLIVPEDKSYYLLDVSPGIYRSSAQRLETSAKHPGEMTAWVGYASVLPSIVSSTFSAVNKGWGKRIME